MTRVTNDTRTTTTKKRRTTSKSRSFPKPQEIKESLDSIVVGQESAKKTLAVAVSNHYARIHGNGRDVGASELADVTVEKSNILLIGPTGCGKTYVVKALAEELNVPFCMADATSLTEAGYVGEDVSSVLEHLIRAANGNIKAAEKGIVYIDEFDKLRATGENLSTTRDVGGEGVQQALLRMIEGCTVNVPISAVRHHPECATLPIDTTNILFICGGAFVGLENVVANRLPRRTTKDLLSQVTPHDLIKFGIIPEIVGRLPVVTALNPLSLSDLQDILTGPRNALTKQYRKQCLLQGFDVTFTPCGIKAIAEKAMKLSIGARALRSVVEAVMLDVQFAAQQGCRYVINNSVVNGRTRPKPLRM